MKPLSKPFSVIVVLVTTIISLWGYSSLLLRSAIRLDGIYLDKEFPLIPGGYANDWFPFLAACFFAMGLSLVFFNLISMNVYDSRRIILTFGLYALVMLVLLVVVFNLEHRSVLRTFFEAFLVSFMFGGYFGSLSSTAIKSYIQQ